MREEYRELIKAHFLETYPQLKRDGSYVGWVSNFHGATYEGHSVSWNPKENPEDRFMLYCLASAWSRAGRWEGPVRLAIAMNQDDDRYRSPQYWAKGEDKDLEQALARLVDAGNRNVEIPGGRNASARGDCAASFKVIGHNFESINKALEKLTKTKNIRAFYEELRSFPGTGTGSKKWSIKIPLILRELWCAGWKDIPPQYCCVPDIRVRQLYKNVGDPLPHDIFAASERIYKDFGTLFDLPPFFVMDLCSQSAIHRRPHKGQDSAMPEHILDEWEEALFTRGAFADDARPFNIEGCDRLIGQLAAVFDRAEAVEKRVQAPRTVFQATLRANGIEVTNLGPKGFLPWSVFCVALEALREYGPRVSRGSLRGGVLGSNAAPLRSIDGAIAWAVYDVPIGAHSLSRIVPVAALLVAAGVATSRRGYLELNANWRDF